MTRTTAIETNSRDFSVILARTGSEFRFHVKGGTGGISESEYGYWKNRVIFFWVG